MNWRPIAWNAMEEPIRVDEDGRVVNAPVTDARWPDDRMLELAETEVGEHHWSRAVYIVEPT